MAAGCTQEAINTTILKANTFSTPCPAASHPDATAVPLTVFDRAALDAHEVVIYAFKPPTPTNEELVEGLSKALSYFPLFSGRLSSDGRGRQCIILNGAGIRLVEASIPTSLEEILPLEHFEDLDDLYPIVDGIEELLQVQISRLFCGGLIISITYNHRVADGQSTSMFIDVWARSVQGLQVERLPYHRREAILTTRSPPRCLFDHERIEYKVIPQIAPVQIDQILLHFPAEFVARLKTKVADGGATRRYSTFQCLLAHLWKKLTLVRGLRDDETTCVKIAVNGRSRLIPSVPVEYFGNLVLWAYPSMTTYELLTRSYAQVSDTIRQAVEEIDDAYFKSFIDYGEILRVQGREDLFARTPEGSVLSPNLEVNSWLTFNFQGLDFGYGAPDAFMVPPDLIWEGQMEFVHSPKDRDQIDVYVGVMHEMVHRFEQLVQILD